MRKVTFSKICLSLTVLFVSAQVYAQVWGQDQEIGTWYDEQGTRLQISMTNDSVCSFVYVSSKGYPNNWKVRGIQYEAFSDSLIFYRPIGKMDTPRSEVHIETYKTYSEALHPTIENHTIFYDRGMMLMQAIYYSLDGVDFQLVNPGEVISNLSELPDSMMINGIWEKFDQDKKKHSVYIDQQFNVVHPPQKKSKEGFPYYFDRIKLVKHLKGSWTLENKGDFDGYNMNLFKEIRPVIWSVNYRQSFEVNLNDSFSFIDKQVINKLVGNPEQFGDLNWSEFSNLNEIEIQSNDAKIKFFVPENMSISIHAGSSLKYVDLLTGSDSILKLRSNIPIRKHDFKTVNSAFFDVHASNELALMTKSSKYFNELTLDLDGFEGEAVFDSAISELKSLTIICDTIDLNCENFKLGNIDSLVIYGYAKQYDFLNCPHNLSYLGVHYSNETDLPLLKRNYPNLEYHEYCFPESAKVNISNNQALRIDQIRLGDKVQAIDSNDQVIESQVVAIEYHFNTEDSLTYLYTPAELVSLESFQFQNYAVQYASGHPLNTTCGNLDFFDSTLTDCSIKTISGEINASYFQVDLIPYCGTLINIRTAEGNFFVDDIGFLNK
ncbi:MAG: hypothetical protein GQ574_22155 [Crocinitomix sp.]|nr:hypothetical protein [Crocinitomix sp.]